MPNTHSTLSSLFTAIADAIRSKTGSSAQIVADNFPTEIANIPSGGIDPSDATATAGDILSGKTAYISGGKTTGSMPDNGSVDVTLDTTNTSYTVAEGKHSGSGTVKVVPQTKSATPTTSAQTVSADSGKVLSSVSVGAIQTQTKSATPSGSSQTITPDSGKYLSSVSVGAVTKNSGIGQTLYNQGVSDTKVGTATASDVLSGKTFTNNTTVGESGGMPERGAWTASVTPSTSAQTVTIPEGHHNGNGYVSVGASSGALNTSGQQVADFNVDSATVTCPYTLQQGKNYLIIKDNNLPLTATGTPGIKNMGSLVPVTYQLSVGSSKTFGLLYMNGTTQPTFTGTTFSYCNIKIVEF